jgi:adenosylhomocysteine nucleosidase
MPLRYLLKSWLQNEATSRLRDAAGRAVEEQLSPTSSPQSPEEPKPCHLGVIFALGIESGCLEDLLQGLVTIRTKDFVIREGGLNGRRTVMILSGPGRQNAAAAAEILIDGHQPGRIVSAGFAGGLCSDLKRNDILMADAVLNSEGARIAVDLPAGLSAALQRPDVHRGPLLTHDRVVRLPAERKSLFQRFAALGVDMETFAVAEVCQKHNVSFLSVRAINDLADETLPPDVEHLLNQKSGAAQLGAALGAIWRRPASAKDMYQLRENALVASLKLAKFLAEIHFD